MAQQTATSSDRSERVILQNVGYFFRGLLKGHPFVEIAYEKLRKGGLAPEMEEGYARRIADFAVLNQINKPSRLRLRLEDLLAVGFDRASSETHRNMLEELLKREGQHLEVQKILANALLATIKDNAKGSMAAWRILAKGDMVEPECIKKLVDLALDNKKISKNDLAIDAFVILKSKTPLDEESQLKLVKAMLNCERCESRVGELLKIRVFCVEAKALLENAMVDSSKLY